MLSKIRFHLDENISNAITDGLRRRSIDVTTTPEQRLISASDEQQLEFALAEGRVIFTQDTDFLRLHETGMNHAGIIYCNQGSRRIGDIIVGESIGKYYIALETISDFPFAFTLLGVTRLG